MKNTLFLTMILAGIFFSTKAQTVRKAGFMVSFPDKSTKSFFDLHPDVERIVIHYKNDEALALDVYRHDMPTTGPNEAFFLKFEGDRYLLCKKYKSLSIPTPGKLRVEYLSGIKKPGDSGTYYRLETTLRPDSIIYHYHFYTVAPDVAGINSTRGNQSASNPSPHQQKASQTTKKIATYTDDVSVYPYRAMLKSDFSQLQKTMEQEFQKWKPIDVGDSVVLASGIVDKDGRLGKLKLETGQSTSFATHIMEVFEQQAASWWPAVVSTGTKVRYKARFFVRLNMDHSLTVSIF